MLAPRSRDAISSVHNLLERAREVKRFKLPKDDKCGGLYNGRHNYAYIKSGYEDPKYDRMPRPARRDPDRKRANSINKLFIPMAQVPTMQDQWDGVASRNERPNLEPVTPMKCRQWQGENHYLYSEAQDRVNWTYQEVIKRSRHLFMRVI